MAIGKRPSAHRPRPRTRALNPRHVAFLLAHPSESLTDEQRPTLATLGQGEPTVAVAYPPVQAFVQMFHTRTGGD